MDFVLFTALLLSSMGSTVHDDAAKKSAYLPYEVAARNELKPHRRTIPLDGIQEGLHQLRLTLQVSDSGAVLSATPNGMDADLKFWPDVRDEVLLWRFSPFEENGVPAAVNVEEYLDMVPAERFPRVHVASPEITRSSKISITLERTGCFGDCPGYAVTITPEQVQFEGKYGVVVEGKHTGAIDRNQVSDLARRFVNGDFYSMSNMYVAGVTDNPTYMLSISIDGRSMQVTDYVGAWVGMPAVITELERAVDEVAQTGTWISGDDGLVSSLKAERFRFQTPQAQAMVKAAASRGKTATVEEFLKAGVPLRRLPSGKKRSSSSFPAPNPGWLESAAEHKETLAVLIGAGASKKNQTDKDQALAKAARSGNVDAVRALIDYGANPTADLSKLTVTEDLGGMQMESHGPGSLLIDAAESGNPAMLREMLQYRPGLETRDREGKTAIFAAGDFRDSDAEGARVECVRLLVEAGADVNARDSDGNTPLHETFLTDVVEELLRDGADVNAQNEDGETPIFTTVDNEAIPLFIAHGADLSIRNKKGQTISEAAKAKGPAFSEALRAAMLKKGQ